MFRFVFAMILMSVCAERHDIHEVMYRTLAGASGCFRRLNGTHQFGCSSPRKGSYGVVQMIETEAELDFILHEALAGPYVVVISPRMLNIGVLNDLKKTGDKISGIVFTDKHNGTAEFPVSYSPDDTCPNSAESNCDEKNPWNPYGNNFMFTNWEIPIFLVTDETNYNTIVDCYRKFNLPLDDSQLNNPLCSLHLESHMFAAVNSDVCMRRINYHFINPVKYCDPVGGENVIFPMHFEQSEKPKYIVIMTRIDSASLFDGIAPGAMSSVTGLATALLTANILYDTLPQKSSYKIIFMLFNGEYFDYIGSTRTIYDMSQNSFLSKTNKITIDDVEMVVDISQLGFTKDDSNATVYLHSVNSPIKFMNSLIGNGKQFNLNIEKVGTNELPPTSFTTFHKAAPKLKGIILSNYKNQFRTKYYSGFYDVGASLGYEYQNGSLPSNQSIQYHLMSVAVSLAQTISASTKPINFENYVKTIDQILYCYLTSRKCPLLDIVYPTSAFDPKYPKVLPLYVGVQHALNHMTKATGMLLSYLASERIAATKANCTSDADADYTLIWFNSDDSTGICVNTTLKFMPAVSPAFLIKDYEWTSNKYPTWTESVWDENSLNIFLKPSRTHEIIIFVTGVFTSVISFILVYIIKMRADIIFKNQAPTVC